MQHRAMQRRVERALRGVPCPGLLAPAGGIECSQRLVQARARRGREWRVSRNSRGRDRWLRRPGSGARHRTATEPRAPHEHVPDRVLPLWLRRRHAQPSIALPGDEGNGWGLSRRAARADPPLGASASAPCDSSTSFVNSGQRSYWFQYASPRPAVSPAPRSREQVDPVAHRVRDVEEVVVVVDRRDLVAALVEERAPHRLRIRLEGRDQVAELVVGEAGGHVAARRHEVRHLRRDLRVHLARARPTAARRRSARSRSPCRARSRSATAASSPC